jgi:hypothetical protein
MAATLKCDTIQNAASTNPNITLDGSANATVGGTLAMGSSFKRNKLINGDMGVYQRGSVAATTAGAYTLDRWFVTPTGATVTVTQSTTTVPTGFVDSLNVAGAASVTNVAVYQRIESVNTADLASGVQVTVSGRIYQSTGSAVTTATIALAAPTALDNYTSTTSAATTYTIPSIANATWTTFSNTFTLTTSCVNGLQVTIALGTGLTTGSFNLTGVQLEVGSVATPYERQIYSDQLAQCQRYYQITAQLSGATPSATTVNAWGTISPTMRVAPTLGQTGVLNFQGDGTNNANQSATGLGSNFSTAYAILLLGVPNFAGFTTARPGTLAVPGSNSNYITMSAEL